MSPDPRSVTRLLLESRSGNKEAFHSLIPIVYEQLHRLAARCLKSERPDLEESVMVHADAPSIVIALDDALQELASRDARKIEIVELLFFGGLTYDETAAALNISAVTVHRS